MEKKACSKDTEDENTIFEMRIFKAPKMNMDTRILNIDFRKLRC